MTHLKAQETQRNVSRRKEWKLRLIQSLYDRGYDRSAILSLFTFVDWVMILPETAKLEFWQELKVYEERRKMPYITSVEQIGYDRGVKDVEERSRELLLEAQRSLILRLLNRKIRTLSANGIDRINALPIERLESLGEDLLDFGSIDDLITWFEK